MKKLYSLSLAVAFLGLTAMPALAGPPFTNVEGVGGVALNPLAFVANSISCEGGGLSGSDYVSKPNIGAWHIDLADSADIQWDTYGANMSFFERIELGYGHESINVEGMDDIDKDNLSAKLMLVKEGDFGVSFMPAVSVGAIYKYTDADAMTGLDESDMDYYVVASKHFMDLPMPVVLNAGILSSKGVVRGVLGFGDDRDEAFFGNIEVLPTFKMGACPDLLKGLIVGVEYLDDIDAGAGLGFETHAMWNAHVAWMHKGLTLIGAYLNTGTDDDDTDPHQLQFGDGFVLSAQFAF
ncbi:MAG: DUF3034 family protein [Desulfobulbaceae bacterium]|nr:DUF3034 family protein [Desulfobulbaceae bacterium]